jgi:hypothetical protein
MKNFATSALIAALLLGVALLLGNRNHAAAVIPLKPGAANFVVSSPGDAGPGTLRDAILAADRLSDAAHISITVKRITIETALPALVNRHGITIEAGPAAGVIDAARLPKGAALQIAGPGSAIKGVTLVNAHEVGIVVSAPGAQLTGIGISDSKVGVFLSAGAGGCVIQTALFERNETAVTAEGAVRDVAIVSSIFRSNTRAGFWFVGNAEKNGDPTRQSVRITDDVFEKNAAGVVLANRPTLVQKTRFIDNRDAALLILGGSARIEDSEIRHSGATGISVSAARGVEIVHNTLIDNPSTAILVRDSEVLVEHNTLQHNGSGIVAIASKDAPPTVLRDNLITKSTADAITIIGGSPQLQRNQLLDNTGAGVRVLDLVSSSGSFKATPRLDANVVKGNGVDVPTPGIYKLAGVLPAP